MEATTVLEMDIRRKEIIPVIQAMQTDTGRMVRCYLAGISQAIERVRIYCKKPSGKETYTEGTILSNNCVAFSLTEQMLAEVGNTSGWLHMLDGSRVITSFKFALRVEENPIAKSNITSSDSYQALVDLLQRLEKFDLQEITNQEIDNLGGIATQNALNVQKIYGSEEEMNAGFSTDGLQTNAVVMIATGNIEDEVNGRVYKKGIKQYDFLVDLSGATGKAATITIGTTKTGAAGTEAEVKNSGSESDAVLDFTIPKGNDGKVEGMEEVTEEEIDALAKELRL